MFKGIILREKKILNGYCQIPLIWCSWGDQIKVIEEITGYYMLVLREEYDRQRVTQGSLFMMDSLVSGFSWCISELTHVIKFQRMIHEKGCVKISETLIKSIPVPVFWFWQCTKVMLSLGQSRLRVHRKSLYYFCSFL